LGTGTAGGAGGLLGGGQQAADQLNRVGGALWENTLAQGLRNQGLQVEEQVRIMTPYGLRIMDLLVRNPLGELLYMVEANAGTSRYAGTLQQTMDNWISVTRGVPVFVWRVPWSRPWP